MKHASRVQRGPAVRAARLQALWADGRRHVIVLKPGSYGHVVANANPGTGSTSFSDFVRVENLSIWGYKDWSPNALDGLHLEVAFNGYAKTDPFNRVRNVSVWNMAQRGFYVRGRGEFVAQGLFAYGCGSYGIHMHGMSDYKVFDSNAAGCSKAGIKVESSGAGHWVGCKSFYNGGGGLDYQPGDCANWHLTADQMRNGLTYFTNCEGQESRGSSWVIESGLNIFTNCQGLDPGRDGLTSTAVNSLPAVIAGFHLRGAEARQNTFAACFSGPSVAIYNMSNNWGVATDAVYVDGVDGNGAGPQKNRGDIFTFVPTTNAGGTADPGTNYRATFGAKGGGGTSNAKNVGLRIDGVALT